MFFFPNYDICSFLFRELGDGDNTGIGDNLDITRKDPGEEYTEINRKNFQ